MAYLRLVPEAAWGALYVTELDSALLSDIVQLLAMETAGASEGGGGGGGEGGGGGGGEGTGEASAAAETAFVLSLLRGLTRAGRFAFSVGFFSEADKAACAQVFDWLAAAEAGEAGAGSVVSSVRAMYLG